MPFFCCVVFSLSRTLSLISFIALAHENATAPTTNELKLTKQSRKVHGYWITLKLVIIEWMNEWAEWKETSAYNSELLPLALKWHWSMSCYQECVCGCTIGNYHYNKFSSISFSCFSHLTYLLFFFFTCIRQNKNI